MRKFDNYSIQGSISILISLLREIIYSFHLNTFTLPNYLLPAMIGDVSDRWQSGHA